MLSSTAEQSPDGAGGRKVGSHRSRLSATLEVVIGSLKGGRTARMCADIVEAVARMEDVWWSLFGVDVSWVECPCIACVTSIPAIF